MISAQYRLLTTALLLAALPVIALAAEGKEGQATPVPTAPDYRCEANVFYVWKRIPPPPPPQQVNATDGEGTLYSATEVFFQAAEESGPVKEDVERALKKKLLELETEAQKLCEKTRQNPAACVTDRLTAEGQTLSQLDFEARRLIREQIAADCTSSSGICLPSKSSEIVCSGGAVASSSSAPAETPKGSEPKKK